MNRNALLAVVAVVAFGVGALVGVVGYTFAVGGTGEASVTLSAPTLSPFDGEALATENAALRAQVDALSTAAAAQVVAPAATEEVTVEATPEPTVEAAASAAQAVTFSIVPEQSQVSFSLDEDLRGQRVTVLGVTNQVAGQIQVNFANPAASRLGTIRINMRTLQTDNEFRNRAIRSEILLTSRPEYEFADFTPKQIVGLPAQVAVGDTVTFQVVGDLPLAGVTREVTFDVTLTVTSETQIEGTAVAQVLRSDYGLQIPNVPGVANVTDEVALEIRFVAVAQS